MKVTKKIREFNSNVTIDTELKRVEIYDKRFYQVDEETYYPSVTTVLSYFPKNKYFENWLKEVGANADIIVKKAADEGSAVHNAIEQLLLGKEIEWFDQFNSPKYPLIVWRMINKFVEFWETHNPTLIATEVFLYSDELKTAGTADLVVEIDGEVWLIDIKTSNSLHRSYDLQTAAYKACWDSIYDRKIDRRGILWLKSSKRKPRDGYIQGKGWELKECTDYEKDIRIFKNIYELYMEENSKITPSNLEYPTTLKL